MRKMTGAMGLRSTVVLWLLVLAAIPSPALAQAKDSTTPLFPGQTEGNFNIKDFHFNGGEVLPELRLHCGNFTESLAGPLSGTPAGP